MLHLFSVLWNLLHHHRRHWLGVFMLLLLCGVGLQAGMREMNAELTKHYERATAVQQPTLREQMAVKRMQRRAMRKSRTPHLHGAAPAPFPTFGAAAYPVERVPDWGAMRSPQQWTRTYAQMTAGDFVELPPYDLDVLTMPMADLLTPLRKEHIPAITAKLVYSTRFFSAYDIDAGEFTGKHPGIDIKLALGTPVGAVGAGRVVEVAQDDHLGLFVMVEHRLPGEGAVFSIYGHFGSAAVSKGDDVEAGQTLGTVGMTGKTTAPHLHLQIDKGVAGQPHVPYRTDVEPKLAEIHAKVLHPIAFIEKYRRATVAVGDTEDSL